MMLGYEARAGKVYAKGKGIESEVSRGLVPFDSQSLRPTQRRFCEVSKDEQQVNSRDKATLPPHFTTHV